LEISGGELSQIRKRNPNDSPELFKAFQEYAITARSLYLERAAFLLSREDLLQRLNSLYLSNQWYPGHFEIEYTANGYMPTTQEPSFFDPVHERNLNVLQYAAQITRLEIAGFEISKNYLISMHSLHSLHSVVFRVCSAQWNIRDAVTRGEYNPTHLVLNIRMFVSGEVTGDGPNSMWYLLPFFVNIKTLTIQLLRDGRDQFPPPEVRGVFNPFQKLERFDISGTSVEVWRLVDWIQAGISPDETLKLTHFKIKTRRPILLDEFTQLLEVLSHAPQIHTCVFDGLATSIVVPSVFDAISRYLPGLVGLTVATYDDTAGRSGRSYAAWPSPTWEYAMRFSGLPFLQYFSWNNRFLKEFTPIWIVLLEDGFPVAGSDEKWQYMFDAVQHGHIDEYQSVAAAFAAYCPTLQAITLASQGLSCEGCYIHRQDGKLSFEPVRMGGLRVTEKWDTDPFGGGWPIIYPSQ
jgi:hypothetical protein